MRLNLVRRIGQSHDQYPVQVIIMYYISMLPQDALSGTMGICILVKNILAI